MTGYPSIVEIANSFLERSGCRISSSGSGPGAEGGAYNSTGQRARTCNTFQALLHPEGSKAPVPSFPGSTFPAGAQGMVLEAVVDLNILSCPVPIIMRERGEFVK